MKKKFWEPHPSHSMISQLCQIYSSCPSPVRMRTPRWNGLWRRKKRIWIFTRWAIFLFLKYLWWSRTWRGFIVWLCELLVIKHGWPLKMAEGILSKRSVGGKELNSFEYIILVTQQSSGEVCVIRLLLPALQVSLFIHEHKCVYLYNYWALMEVGYKEEMTYFIPCASL